MLCKTEYWTNKFTVLRKTKTCHINIINIRIFILAVTFQECSPCNFKIQCNRFSLKVMTASNNFYSIISDRTVIPISTAIKISYAGLKFEICFDIQRNICHTAIQPFWKKNWVKRTSFKNRPNRGYCSRRDGAGTSVKTVSWAGRTHLQ
jgi:hypothetical protein